MYGGSGKLGRGGGGGGGGRGAAGKRNVHTAFHPPPLNRSAAPGGRLSVGSGAGPRNRKVVSGPTISAPPATEETFSLVTGNPLDFAMIIRLAPDLVEEIKRVEAQGGTARIKFDSNPSGNVIDVGGKDFRFTWSREMGDLCDIYEERRSGEDGNGLLVESGCAWRKLNVQRVLDESTKNHVKMRSEEAERLKQRKPIVLEHGNPSVKSQMKALAEAEAPQWKNFNHKKEAAFKKRRVDPPVAVGGHPKSVSKPMLSSTTPAKGRHSLSPLTSPPEHSGAPASPFQAGNHTKGPSSVEDITYLHGTSKENVTSSDKVLSRAISGAVREKSGVKGNVGAKTMDLQSMLISLLMENHRGMTLKALEKAIGDAIPHSARKIEPIIKKIATFQAPGRYFLKPGLELKNFKKSSSESGSHPQGNCHQTHAPEDNRDQVPAPKLDSAGEAATSELDKEAELNSKSGEEINSSDKIDILDHSPDLFGDKKVSDNSEGPAGSSSDSGSDSDSDSESSDSGSDSGSHSRSRSKSRSPVGSGTGSSSDSESDASSNSKEGSDEDVNIMTSDDEKDPKDKLQASEHTSPIPWTSDGGPLQNEIDEKQDEHGSEIVEIEKDLPDDDHLTEMAVVTNSPPNEEGEKAVEECKPSSSDSHENQESQAYTGNLFTERENTAKDGFKHEQSDSIDKISKGKSKRGSDAKHLDEKSERAKRLKSGDSRQPQISRNRDSLFSESPHGLSPDRFIEEPYKGPSTQMKNRATRDGNSDSGLQKGYNQAILGKSILDSQQSDRRSVDLDARLKAPDTVERPGKQAESLGRGAKYPEKSFHVHEGLPNQKDKVYRETHYVDDYPNDKNLPGISKEDGVGDKHATPLDSHCMKHSELVGKFKDAEPVLNSCMGDNNRINADRSPVINGRGNLLQRELSDLELGEFREPLSEETPEVNKQFEKRNSFKKSENKPSTSGYWNLESSKGKPAGKTNVDSRNLSPARLRVSVPANPECSVPKRTPEHHTGDTRLQNRAVQSLSQHMPRVDHTEVGSQFNKIAYESSKTRHDETGVSQKSGLERFKDASKKEAVNAPQQHDTKRRVVPQITKGSKSQKLSTLGDFSNGRKDTSLTESNDGGQKRRDSSSDENNSYSKYEKEEPELKGPIKDFSQYKEYVHEYREKYSSYCSLNKILEAYRNEFQKLGRDLDSAKERDLERYNSILEQFKESYRQCGTRHKYLKKIFIVLHEELKHLKQMIKDFAASYARN